jgi:hypothetical protein
MSAEQEYRDSNRQGKRRAKGKKPTADWRTHPLLVAYDIELVQRFGAGIQKLFEGAIGELEKRIALLEASAITAEVHHDGTTTLHPFPAPDLSGEQSKAFQELAERGVE